MLQFFTIAPVLTLNKATLSSQTINSHIVNVFIKRLAKLGTSPWCGQTLIRMLTDNANIGYHNVVDATPKNHPGLSRENKVLESNILSTAEIKYIPPFATTLGLDANKISHRETMSCVFRKEESG